MSSEREGLETEVGGFRLGLSRLIRYSYGGLLLAFLAALLDPIKTKGTIEALSAPVAIAVAIGVGAAIYILHRHVLIPLHHLGLCGLFQVLGRKSSPTAFLRDLKVRPGKLMLAYTLIRWSDFFRDKEARDIAHAENGLLILTSEGFFVATWYAAKFIQSDAWVAYLVVGIIFLIASYFPAYRNHSWECFLMREEKDRLVPILQSLHLLPPTHPNAPQTLPSPFRSL